MIAIIFKMFMTVNSLMLTFMVFLIKEQIVINPIHQKLSILPHWTSYLLYFIIVIMLSWVSIKFAKLLDTDSIERGAILGVEPANDIFLPSYLGYFFVALSVPNFEVFCIVFGIIAIFIFYSRASYFNPVFFVLGYHFFFVEKENSIKTLIITKKKLKIASAISFDNLKRINDYTFLELSN